MIDSISELSFVTEPAIIRRVNRRQLCRFVMAFVMLVLGGSTALRAQGHGNYPAPFNFNTLAGSGSQGSTDGTGNTASFYNPSGVAVDGSGNVYVADTDNNTIRKITPNGTVTTLAGLAGSSNYGSTDGSGSSARFNGPFGLAVDNSGTLYVADTSNETIRKITPGGVVTTLAGSAGVSGSTDGTASAARFFQPVAIAVDGGGNLYVADASNGTIRKITAGGTVSTLAGTAGQSGSTDGTGSAARFSGPSGIGVDSGGNIYVTDENNDTIRKITSGGVVTTLAGSPGQIGHTDGTGSAATFFDPYGLAVDGSGNLFVADNISGIIRKITPGGAVTTVAGEPSSEESSNGTGTDARFYGPTGVAVDGSGNVYVADRGNSLIRKGALAPPPPVPVPYAFTTIAGSAADSSGRVDGTGSAARFDRPYSVAADSSGNIFVLDGGTPNILRKVTPSGVVTTSPVPLDYYPSGMAFDRSGNLYLTEGGILKITPGGATSTLTYTGLAADGYGVTVDETGNLYVLTDNSVVKITTGGVQTTLAGSGGQGSSDGSGAAASFNNPSNLTIDGSGNLYVADENNQTIRKVTPAGVVSTLAGSPGQIGYADGTGSAARFNFPFGVTIDGSGNLYVEDVNSQTIRKITPDGGVTTFAGVHGAQGNSDGQGSAARFHFYTGGLLTTDSGGNVYVADADNNTIRKITPGGLVSTIAGLAASQGNSDGSGGAARFNYPEGAALDTSGNLYIADTLNNTIRKMTPSGVVTTIAGTAGLIGSVDGTASSALFYQPTALAVDGGGNIYVADSANYTVRKITPGGMVTTLAGSAGQHGITNGTGSAARFGGFDSMALDGSGNIYVIDTYGDGQTLRKITPGGGVTTAVSGGNGVALDGSGNIYLTNDLDTVQKITPGGVGSFLAGSYENPGSSDGTGSGAEFYQPTEITVDGSGNVFVMDSYTALIRKITATGVVTTIAGNSSSPGSSDGTGSAAHFARDDYGQMAVDGSGNLYVLDTNNSTVRKGTVAPVGVDLFAGTVVGSNLKYSSWYGYYLYGSYPLVYEYNLGYEYVYDAGGGGVFLFDYTSGHFWYTSASYFPFVYDYSLNAFLYYYVANTPKRHFYDYGTNQVITE